MHDLSPGLMLDLMHIPNVHIIITTKMCQTRAQHIRVTETTISVTLTGLSGAMDWSLCWIYSYSVSMTNCPGLAVTEEPQNCPS